MSFKVLIVGLGQIGLYYDLHLDPNKAVYSHARAFSRHPDFQLIAGVDNDKKRRQTFEQIYACPAYETVENGLSIHQPDVIVIATPTEYHSTVLQRILELSHPRVVLCEKPLSYDVGQARAMVTSCQAQGIRLYVNYMRRSDRAVIEIKKRIESEQICPPIKGIVWYSKGFLHNGSHFFNLLEYWLGSMKSAEILNPGRMWNDIDPEPDVSVTFSGGTVLFLSAWEERFSHYTVELLASNGRLRYEQGGRHVFWQSTCTDTNLRQYTVLSDQLEAIVSGMEHYQWHVVEQLVLALGGCKAHLCTGAEALKTLETIKRIIKNR